MFDHDQVRPQYPGNSKRARVEEMFDRIAPRYDQLNRLLSLGIDRRWRRRLLREVLLAQPRRVLDVATGTGDLAIALAEAGIAEVSGVDISQHMLAVGRVKVARAGVNVRLFCADGEALPEADDSYDAVTVAFGVRNFEHLEQGLLELLRVLRPGGVLAILELSTPSLGVVRALHGVYCRHIVPRVGAAVSGEGAAYQYLPASVAAFPCGERFLQVLLDNGASEVRCIPLTLGIASLYLATVR
jgi:demethylmenaquinone methyltransferase/2-methoxy-6-polyprenyl-1,4-benzoquinol methylase